MEVDPTVPATARGLTEERAKENWSEVPVRCAAGSGGSVVLNQRDSADLQRGGEF
jgi:hypothetical protein